MSSRAASPSRSPRVDVRGWLAGIRLSGFAVIMAGLVVLGAFVLVPSVGGYIDMRQQIAQASAGVAATEDEIAALELEQARWQDPAYIMTQARERLYYVLPGEVVFLVQDDLPADAAAATEPDAVDPEVSEREDDWMGSMLRSVVASGLAEQATAIDPDVFPED
ncbi:septum formation initiator family protein [Microbacterium sp. ZXX196]|uniref:FtsB family cell division protein n=1 Tax=Microbacterium sp. ZXX196 TaxID=2609291 RepID=UPI0012B79C3F|nr:septum formation initiator family protein [Microbacterium sp. ZXX196]MTE22842.1 septum formation initiator family protein [Microbacterium sp. ZXX196]